MASWMKTLGYTNDVPFKDTLLDGMALLSILMLFLAICRFLETSFSIIMVTMYIMILISNVASCIERKYSRERIDDARRMAELLGIRAEEARNYRDVIDTQNELIRELCSAASSKDEIQEEIEIPTIRKIRVEA